MDHHHHHDDESDLAELLDLDAEVLQEFHAGLLDWVAAAAGRPGRIVDLGAGTGNGSIALARRFPAAEVLAVDASAGFLDRLADRARELGLADRISTECADLDQTWPAVGTVDLAWAATSMHHFADPGQVLAELLAALAPGGLLAVVELDSFPRFLPDSFLPDGAGSGLEARAHAAQAGQRAHDMPNLGADWGPVLAKAGFTVEAARHFTADLAAPLPAATRQYAHATLSRLRIALTAHPAPDQQAAADLAAFDAVLASDGPESIWHRTDLTIRAARTVWLARPSA